MEDAELFLRWWQAGVRSVPLPGPVLHEYYPREGSVMYNARQAENRALWEARRQELLASGPPAGVAARETG